MQKDNIELSDAEPSSMNPSAEELARVIVARLGLNPRKSGSTDKMWRTIIELYERSKKANQEKKPELAIMTVEEMGAFAGITRQTMYDYLRRWTDLDLITKTSYIYQSKVIIGYKLNGSTLEMAFEKAAVKVKNHLEQTLKYVRELQKTIKNEKLSDKMKKKDDKIMKEVSKEDENKT
jgi:hypothetical protein